MDEEFLAARVTPEQRKASMIGVLLALFIAALDQTIVSTATPMIVRELVFPTNWITWLTTAYLVTGTALLPIWGKVSDVYGRKRSLLIGVSVFMLSSLWCGLSQSPLELILARALQGVGSAAIFANAFAVVGDLYEPRDRPKMQGLFGAMFGISSVVGPWIGGLLTDYISWHWVFLVNLPIGIIALTFIARKMPALNSDSTSKEIDYFGAMLLMLFVVPLLLALALAPNTFAWSSNQILAMFLISFVSGAAFIWHELRVKDPIIDLRLFVQPLFGLTALASFILGAAFLSSIVFVPLFMVNVLGVSATSAGATLTPLTLGIVFGNVISGQLVSRIGAYKPVLIPAIALLLVGFLWLAFGLNADIPQWLLIIKLVLLGLGLGPSIPLYTQMMITAAPRNKMGVASSSATFVRQMGSSVGVAVLGTVFSASLTLSMQTVFFPSLSADVLPSFAESFRQSGGSGEGNSNASIDFEALKIQAANNIDQLSEQLNSVTDDNVASLADVWRSSPFAKGQIQPSSAREAQAFARELILKKPDIMNELDKAHRTYQEVWASAIQHIFFGGFFIVLAGFIVTIFIPKVELPPKRAVE